MKKAMLFILGLALTSSVPAVALIDCVRTHAFNKNVEQPLQQAADSKDVGSALKELDVVISYAESNGLNRGKMEKWYLRLKADRAMLEAASTWNDRLNAMARLRASILYENKPPEDARLFPYGWVFTAIYMLCIPIGIFGIIFMLHSKNY